MNNEIQRKITSLTLMTIMLAGGMVIAAPGVIPTVSAEEVKTDNLYVSSINFGGPMVLEITVNDESIGETDEARGQPTVTIDGHDLIMAQGDDGSWYAYVADSNIGLVVDNTSAINFGILGCGTSTGQPADVIEKDDEGTIYCDAKVIKKPQSLNGNDVANGGNANELGQIGLTTASHWPFIQAFEFTDDTSIDVIYNGSPDQVVEITYTEDMDEFASYTLDRTVYPHNADIHLLIDDMQLNIDPTDEDFWAFNTVNGDSYYGENIPTGSLLTSDQQNDLFYDDNGFLSITENSVITLSNTFVEVEETLPNSGLFENTNNADVADLVTTQTIPLLEVM